MKRFTLLFFSIVIASCATETTEPSSNENFVVESGDGVVERFFAVLNSGGERASITCPSKAPVSSEAFGEISCLGEPNGLRFERTPDLFEARVKAKGYVFGTSTKREGITLEKLDAFEKNEDYVTGFGQSDRTGRSGRDTFSDMAFLARTDLGPAEVVKFYADDIRGTPTLYFQNTKKHNLHYPFARNILNINKTLSEFEASTYLGEDRDSMAGNIIIYPKVTTNSERFSTPIDSPITISFFPSDDLNPKQALHISELILERLQFANLTGEKDRVIYLPAGAVQESELIAQTDIFHEHASLWLAQEEMYGDRDFQILNEGVAFGTLKKIDAEGLETTVVSFSDILILTNLPNELPIVAGTISEDPQTPLAHVNVAARSRGTPNMSLRNASKDERLVPFLDKLVRLEVKEGDFNIREATLEEATDFWNARIIEAPEVTFDISKPALLLFSEISFSDALVFGVKCANIAELSKTIPENAPHGFCVPFYYYYTYMNANHVDDGLCTSAQQDCVEEKRDENTCKTAQNWCEDRSATNASFFEYVQQIEMDNGIQSDTLLREAVLDGLRHHIRNTPVDPIFAEQINAKATAVFGDSKVRLRSSTNAEDLPGFSGAGLYKSVSAFANKSGDRPSDEILKVWASTWNWRAYEERNYWGIKHSDVQMGVNVNQAFPNEAANGVLITQNLGNPIISGYYVNVQKGEVPVTNPEGDSLPEVFSIIPKPNGGIQVSRRAFSSLSPETPILTDLEIEKLYKVTKTVQARFSTLYDIPKEILRLDLEFKYDGPERTLFIKQARPYFERNE